MQNQTITHIIIKIFILLIAHITNFKIIMNPNLVHLKPQSQNRNIINKKINQMYKDFQGLRHVPRLLAEKIINKPQQKQRIITKSMDSMMVRCPMRKIIKERVVSRRAWMAKNQRKALILLPRRDLNRKYREDTKNQQQTKNTIFLAWIIKRITSYT